MAMVSRSPQRDTIKWVFFGLMGLCALLVLFIHERFWLDAADPHWKRVANVKGLLLLHGLFGATALVPLLQEQC